MADTPVDFLYTNIGRGPPHYLDGILASLPDERLGSVDDVFSLSRGAGALTWRSARWMYRAGSSWPGLYSKIRAGTDYARRGLLTSLMGAALSERYADRRGPLVVAHPLLVGLLLQHSRLVYQHGEVAVPREATVPGDHRVLVPDGEAARIFIRDGFAEENVHVTGFCIEPSLQQQAESAYAARQSRLSVDDVLGVAMFSSGAEPRKHIESLVRGAISATRSNHRVFLFARRNGRLQHDATRAFREAELNLETPLAGPRPGTAAIYCFEDRTEIDALTTRHFRDFDVFVAPSHERTLWALGLGLPMLIVEPAIGSYAPLNRDRMIREGVGQSLDPEGAPSLGDVLTRMQSEGQLRAMAEAGWGRYELGGFQAIADLLDRI